MEDDMRRSFDRNTPPLVWFSRSATAEGWIGVTRTLVARRYRGSQPVGLTGSPRIKDRFDNGVVVLRRRSTTPV